MHKNLFIIICLLFICGNTYSQDKEKMISNQSLLIDAIREEQIGNKDKAIEILEKLKYEPDFRGVCNFYLAKIYRSTGKMEEAFEAIDQSILSEPDNTWYLIMKTNMTEEYGRNLETALTFEKLCNLEPNNFSHYDNAAYFFLKAEEFKKALDILNKAEHTFGIVPSIAIKKSYVLTVMKKNKNALEVLENCYTVFPSNKELVLELIKAYSEANNTEQAAKYIDKLKLIDPNNDELNQWTTKKAIEPNNQKAKSTDEVIQSPDLSLDDKVKYLFTRLNTAISKSDKSGILSLLNPAENLRHQYPADPKTIAIIGDIQFQLNNLLQAKEAYVQATRDGQVPYSVWDNLLFCLIHLNHWKTASYFADKCMDLYPNQSFPNYVYILSKFKLNQLQDIVKSIEQLELMVSHNDHKKTELLILKAKILSELKKDEDSANSWKLALETDHDYLASLEYSVFMASKGASYPKDYFEKAMNSEFIHESFKLDKAAELFYYLKDYAKAKQYIENSISKGYCESTDTLLLAAKIYEATGDLKTSQEFRSKARVLIESESDQSLPSNNPAK
jgi:tetratricopeptide (TPR) repeat protein